MTMPIFALAASTTPGPLAETSESAQRDPSPQRDFADMLARQSQAQEGSAVAGDKATAHPVHTNGANGQGDSRQQSDRRDAEPLATDAGKDDQDTTPDATLLSMAMPQLPQQALEIAARAAEVVAQSTGGAYRSTAMATATTALPALASGNPQADHMTAGATANATADAPPALSANTPIPSGTPFHPGQSDTHRTPAEIAQAAATLSTQSGQNQHPVPASSAVPASPATAALVQDAAAAMATPPQAVRNTQPAPPPRAVLAVPAGHVAVVEQDTASVPKPLTAVSAGSTQASASPYAVPPASVPPTDANATEADARTRASATATPVSAGPQSHESPERSAAPQATAIDTPQPPLAALAQHGTAITPAPGGVSHALIASPVGATKWGIDVGRQLATFTRNQQDGQIKAELRLDPPDLGPLRITLSLNDGVATASFVSAHASVRQAVEAALPQLQQAFAQAGLSLGQSSVHDQGAGNGAGYDQQPSQGRDNPERAWGRDDAFAGTPSSLELSGPAKTLIANALIDTYA